MAWFVARTIGALAVAWVGATVALPAAARDCEAWNGRAEIRCLSHVAMEEWLIETQSSQGAHVFDTVTLRNIGSGAVDFTYQSWQSVCNVSGTSAPAVAATLQPAQEMRFDLRGLTMIAHAPEADPNAGTTPAPLHGGGLGLDTVLHPFLCTELFFLQCKAGGAAVDCQDHLTATIETPS